MDYRVNLDFIGRGGADSAYGGYLNAWSFRDINGTAWFAEFRDAALSAIGTKFLPIYRMADGEYRFLMGRRFDPARKPRMKEIAAILAERLRIKNPDRWKTSWGEEYPPEKTRELRAELVENIRYLSHLGYLACYINDNGLNAFTNHNMELPGFFERHGISFGPDNYVPFHFAPSLFISQGWQSLIKNRSILIVTGMNPEKESRIRDTLSAMGAGLVQVLPISSSSSMTDQLDLSTLGKKVDVSLVAAGIGSANVLRQLEPLNTLAVDIGGLMNCFVDRTAKQHGGVIRLPEF